MILYRATLETFKFSFEAYGATKSAAIQAMQEGLEKHCIQYNMPIKNFMQDFGESIECYPVMLGAAYRDRGEL